MLKPQIALQVVNHDTPDLAYLIILTKHCQTEIVHKWPLALVLLGNELIDQRHVVGHYLVEVQYWLVRVVIGALYHYFFEVFAIIH